MRSPPKRPKSLKKKEKDADEIFTRLFRIVDDSDGNDLPAEIDLQGIPMEIAWSVWTEWQASGKRFLPFEGALVDQPKNLMNVLYLFDSLLNKVTQQYMEKKKANGSE